MDFFFCLYLLAALVAYEKTIERRGDFYPREESKEPKTPLRKYLRGLCITGAAVASCTMLEAIIAYNTRRDTDSICTLTIMISGFFYTFFDTVVYTFLWLRQYLLNEWFHIKNVYMTRFLSLCKWGMLSAILAFAALKNFMIVIHYNYRYNATTRICDNIKSEQSAILGKLWISGSIAFHTILVVLFVCPLLKHYYDQKTSAGDESPISKAVRETQCRLLSLVKRCILVSLLCITCDVLAEVLAHLHRRENFQLRTLIYNVNILLNVLLVCCSFTEWKSMLFPWKKILVMVGCLERPQADDEVELVEP